MQVERGSLRIFSAHIYFAYQLLFIFCLQAKKNFRVSWGSGRAILGYGIGKNINWNHFFSRYYRFFLWSLQKGLVISENDKRNPKQTFLYVLYFFVLFHCVSSNRLNRLMPAENLINNFCEYMCSIGFFLSLELSTRIVQFIFIFHLLHFFGRILYRSLIFFLHTFFLDKFFTALSLYFKEFCNCCKLMHCKNTYMNGFLYDAIFRY